MVKCNEYIIYLSYIPRVLSRLASITYLPPPSTSVLALAAARICEVVYAVECRRVLCAKHLLFELQHLLVYLFGLCVLALAVECICEVVHAAER
jgi:hypothetical protein